MLPTPAPDAPERPIDRVLQQYALAHASLPNRVFQALALPLIVWSLIALLTRVPFPDAWRLVPGADWAGLVALLVVAGYATLSWPLAVGLGVFSGLSILLARAYVRWGELPIWQLAITTMLIGWGLHVLGRKLERQSFAASEELRSLLVGPAWLLSALYRAFGVRY